MISNHRCHHLSIMGAAVLAWPALGDETQEILDLPGSGTDTESIDYATLPVLSGDHVVIHAAETSPGVKPGDKLEMSRLRLQLHNYLVHHDGKFWCIWSDGPRIEDWPTQEVKFATSEDGMRWSEAEPVTGTPKEPYAYIARGLWVREGELLSLVAHYKGHGAFGADKELQLQAFRRDGESDDWKFAGKVHDDAINNFPPARLPGGNWILTRRDSHFNVSVLIGGVRALDDWEAHPVVGVKAVTGFRPDEPIFWTMPDKTLNALFRDNGGSLRLFHAVSGDGGKTWSTPRLSNFPNATSKIFSLQSSRGYRILISNANPQAGRRELHVSLSEDGTTFTRMARLDIPAPPVTHGIESLAKKFEAGLASLQYPHAIEHEGSLWIALSRNKVQTELFRVSLEDVSGLLR